MRYEPPPPSSPPRGIMAPPFEQHPLPVEEEKVPAGARSVCTVAAGEESTSDWTITITCLGLFRSESLQLFDR